MLETTELTKYFGGLCAVNNISLTVESGEIVGLIGPNGAGKTTIFNLLTGFIRPSSGAISFQDKEITGLKPHAIAELGMVRTFQLVRILPNFTVTQNMIAASHLHPKIGLWEAIFNTIRYQSKEKKILESIAEILDLVQLESFRNILAKNLAHGHQKMLGIAMALAAKPRLLLLDESLGGMNPSEVEQALTIMDEIKKRNIAIFLIEHNVQAVMTICDRLYVINFGTEICRGLPEEIQQNQDVITAYLGTKRNA